METPNALGRILSESYLHTLIGRLAREFMKVLNPTLAFAPGILRWLRILDG